MKKNGAIWACYYGAVPTDLEQNARALSGALSLVRAVCPRGYITYGCPHSLTFPANLTYLHSSFLHVIYLVQSFNILANLYVIS